MPRSGLPVTTPVGPTSPPPTGPALGGYDDAMSALYATLSEVQQNDVSAGESQVADDQLQQRNEEAQQHAAIQKEQANQANSGGGFFSDIGHFLGDVASDLAHGRIGDAFEDGGHDLEQAWNSPKFWSDIETGLQDVAIVAGATAAVVATGGAAGIPVVAGLATAAAGTAAIAEAGSRLAGARVAHFAAAAEDASADATADGDRITQLQSLSSDVIANLKQSDQSHERELASLTQSIETNDQTLVEASSTTVKG